MKKKVRLIALLFAVVAGMFGLAAPVHATPTDHYVDLEVGSAPGYYDGVSGCNTWVTYGAPSRVLLCGSQVTTVTWADGRKEVSGLGTDHAIWSSRQTTPGGSWAPWASLGGENLKYGVAWPNPSTIGAWGADNSIWGRTFDNGWGPWHIC
ncbi:hypothetical protein PUR61_06815 [Streptomyces sp. BE20]|uniref:hypothetical protein n=1 Tax=Streptomycetaceae TaxID=2062 RepID=UPI002E77E6B0|nr:MULTISPECIES: hypothetical protein [unclassified Streptomyces]MED7951558.1 hypothetical protein [Streptomyces sp. BE303]MEE1821903.1 hypothetical protein [Streptomyces sp. BE20]